MNFIGPLMVGQGFSAKPLKLASLAVNKQLYVYTGFMSNSTTKKATPEEVALVPDVYVKRWRSGCYAGVELDSFSCGMRPILINQMQT